MTRACVAGVGLILLVAAGCGGAANRPAPTAPAGTVAEIAAPQLIAPADGAQLLPTAPLILTLGDVAGIQNKLPLSFEVEIVDSAGVRVANPTFAPSAAGPTTAYTVTAALAPNAKFTWRARVTGGGEAGAWSAARSFSSPREDVPTLNLPAPALGGADGSFNFPLTFFIYNQTGPNVPADLQYEVEIRSAAGELLGSVSGPISHDGSQGTKLAANMPLPGGVPLTWRARSLAGSLTGPWSVTKTFTIQQTLHVTGIAETDIGTSRQLIASFRQRGTTSDCAPWATWTVDNPSVGRVAAGGLYTAVGLGSAKVTAKCDSASETSPTSSIEIWTGTFRVDSCGPAPCGFGSAIGQTRTYSVTIRSRPGGDRIVTSTGEGTLSSGGVLVIDQLSDSDAGCDTSVFGTRSTVHVNGSQISLGVQSLSCGATKQPVGTVQTVAGTASPMHRGK